jgi:hypothetical protein
LARLSATDFTSLRADVSSGFAMAMETRLTTLLNK